MSAPQTSSDIPLLIKSANSASERRVTPAWTIAHLKTRLEPITGIPASAQTLSLRVGSQDAVPIQAADEESVQLHGFNLQAYAEIFVSRFMLFMLPNWFFTTSLLRASDARKPSSQWVRATNDALPHAAGPAACQDHHVTTCHPGYSFSLVQLLPQNLTILSLAAPSISHGWSKISFVWPRNFSFRAFDTADRWWRIKWTLALVFVA